MDSAQRVNCARTTSGAGRTLSTTRLSTRSPQLPPNDPQEHALFRQALEIRLHELPIISLSQQKRIVPYSTKYWTNWPTAENGYVHPPNWWQTFIVPLVNIKAAGSS